MCVTQRAPVYDMNEDDEDTKRNDKQLTANLRFLVQTSMLQIPATGKRHKRSELRWVSRRAPVYDMNKDQVETKRQGTHTVFRDLAF